MNDLLAEAREMVSWLYWGSSGCGPEKYRQDPAGYSAALAEAAYQWLLQHPREAVEAVRAIGLGKFDCGLVQLLADIGSPLAEPAVPLLVHLLVDLNWPVAVPVRRVLFGEANNFSKGSGKFPKEVILDTGRQLLASRWASRKRGYSRYSS